MYPTRATGRESAVGGGRGRALASRVHNVDVGMWEDKLDCMYSFLGNTRDLSATKFAGVIA